MARRILHAVVVALVLAGAALAAQGTLGGPLPAAAAGVWLLWYLLSVVVLPRLAHAAFRAQLTATARRRYAVLAWISPAAHDAARVSVAGTYLIDRDWRRAGRALAAIDGERLPATLRAAWLNNRAYAIARGGEAARTGDDPLALIDEALGLRPEVPAFLHTRGLALVAAGRIDDGIRAFEAVWDAGELDAGLEAERCHDLAAAWEGKGQPDYATDYRRRAAPAAPGSPWARGAAGEPADLRALEDQIAG